MNKKRLIGIIAACVIVVAVVLILAVGRTPTRDARVAFGDPNLEAAVREAIHLPEGPIRASDLEALSSLSVSGESIADLTGLEYCTGMKLLSLTDNQISDISALSNLTSLVVLLVASNEISDISALISLTNLEWVRLWDNPLSDQSINEYIPELEALGVRVSY